MIRRTKGELIHLDRTIVGPQWSIEIFFKRICCFFRIQGSPLVAQEAPNHLRYTGLNLPSEVRTDGIMEVRDQFAHKLDVTFGPHRLGFQ